MKSTIFLFSLLAYAQTDDTHALRQFHAACLDDKTPLWGVSLWGRLLLVDPNTRSAIATERDPDGKFEQRDSFFFGALPSKFTPSNTSIEWGGNQWAMVMLPLPVSPFTRTRLLAHESFHRLQKELKLNASDSKNAHLDTETGRLWMRMELRALARALRTTGDESRGAVQDAMALRSIRQKLHPGSRIEEASLEIQEGLPEYTGTVLALKNSGESIDRVARAVEDFEDQTSFTRAFAYATGPALGLLLDRFQPAWIKSVTRDTDLAGLLSAAVGIRNPAPRDRYGYQSISAEEREREARHQKLLTKFRTSFLDGPILQFPKTEDLNRNFNPYNLISLGEHGTVYPTGTFTSRWGKLYVEDVGALLSPDYQSLRVVAPKDANTRPLTGPGWKLDLAPGWTVHPGSRAGDFEVVPEP